MTAACMPLCPGGHTMHLDTAAYRRGSDTLYAARCRCYCNWMGPVITSTSRKLAEQKAIELAGGAVIPDDHLMDSAEARAWVKKHIAGRRAA